MLCKSLSLSRRLSGATEALRSPSYTSSSFPSLCRAPARLVTATSIWAPRALSSDSSPPPKKMAPKRAAAKSDEGAVEKAEKADAAEAPKKAKKEAPPKEMFPKTEAPRAAFVGPSFKVMSWNVAGLRSVLKAAEGVANLQKLVATHKPDVLFLQEHKLQESHVKVAQAQLVKELPEYTEYHWACSTAEGKKGYSGVVALIRAGGVRPLGVTYGLGSSKTHFDEGRCVALEYEKFIVQCIYVPNSGEGLKRLEYRLNDWEPAMRNSLKEQDARKPVLLIGDLNVGHLDNDIYNHTAKHIAKQAGLTPQEREAFGILLKECDLVDAFRSQHPNAAGWFSYWSGRVGNRPFNRGLRLDYTLVSSRLCGPGAPLRVVDSFLDDEGTMGTSDHCPVGIVFTGV